MTLSGSEAFVSYAYEIVIADVLFLLIAGYMLLEGCHVSFDLVIEAQVGRWVELAQALRYIAAYRKLLTLLLLHLFQRNDLL